MKLIPSQYGGTSWLRISPTDAVLNQSSHDHNIYTNQKSCSLYYKSVTNITKNAQKTVYSLDKILHHIVYLFKCLYIFNILYLCLYAHSTPCALKPNIDVSLFAFSISCDSQFSHSQKYHLCELSSFNAGVINSAQKVYMLSSENPTSLLRTNSRTLSDQQHYILSTQLICRKKILIIECCARIVYVSIRLLESSLLAISRANVGQLSTY